MDARGGSHGSFTEGVQPGIGLVDSEPANCRNGDPATGTVPTPARSNKSLRFICTTSSRPRDVGGTARAGAEGTSRSHGLFAVTVTTTAGRQLGSFGNRRERESSSAGCDACAVAGRTRHLHVAGRKPHTACRSGPRPEVYGMGLRNWVTR